MSANDRTGALAPEVRGALVGERIDAVREIALRNDAAAIVLGKRRDFAWLTLGGLNHVLLTTESGVGPIVVTRDDAAVLAPANEYDRLVDEELPGLPLRTVSIPWWDDDALDAQVRELAADGVVLSDADVADELDAVRTALAPVEHERMRVIATQANAMLDDALAGVGAGIAEHDVEAALVAATAEFGARLPVILVAADERIERYRHPIATDASVRGRVMVVVVVEKWGLHVAATGFRELAPRSALIEQRAAAIGEVLARMRETTVAGKTLGDVLAAARTAYEEEAMPGEWMLHHQGGTIGYAARERIAKPADMTPIRPGMAFAWNPSAVGYKAEETLYLDADGNQHVLTSTR